MMLEVGDAVGALLAQTAGWVEAMPSLPSGHTVWLHVAHAALLGLFWSFPGTDRPHRVSEYGVDWHTRRMSTCAFPVAWLDGSP
jgi:hypothetical protein